MEKDGARRGILGKRPNQCKNPRCSKVLQNVNFFRTKTMPFKCAFGGCVHKSWVHKTLKFHWFPRDQNFKGKWLSTSNLRTRLYKLGASHHVCSAHFRGGHTVRIHQNSSHFPRPDMKTDEIVWPVDISHLQAKKVSEEKEHQKNGTVNQYQQSHSPVCSNQLVWSKQTTRHKQHLNLGSYKDLLSQGKPKKRMWIHVIINLFTCNNFDTIFFVTLSLLFSWQTTATQHYWWKIWQVKSCVDMQILFIHSQQELHQDLFGIASNIHYWSFASFVRPLWDFKGNRKWWVIILWLRSRANDHLRHGSTLVGNGECSLTSHIFAKL